MVKKEDGYIPAHLKGRKNSNVYHAKVFRNPEIIQIEDIMDEFMLFVSYEFYMSQDEMSDLQALVNEFVGYDIKKAEEGEKELLARWKESVNL